MNIHAGDIICAKSITHRIPVEVTETKRTGKRRVRAHQFGYGFQSEHSLLSTVGVFLFLGVCPEEADGGDRATTFARQQLERLGWTCEPPQPDPAVDPVGPAPAAQADHARQDR